MPSIITQNLGKKFRNEWIFRKVNLELISGQNYTFTGANGSGKSTLLQVLAGFIPMNEGSLSYGLRAMSDEQKKLKAQSSQLIADDDFYQHVVMASPYLELVEEFTLSELVAFHINFKPFRSNLSINEFIDFIELPKAKNKAVKYFSSGMKQRLKLGLAFWSDCGIIMLDEPTANLDADATRWYLDNVQNFAQNRLLLIASNQPNEYEFCQNIFKMADFK
jgi:ABC-type multidrug transport system ATPase subunit